MLRQRQVHRSGMNDMEFSCVGLDVRQWPWDGVPGADYTAWDQNEQRYTELMDTFDLYENEYQLLEAGPQTFKRVKEAIHAWADCNLVAVEYPRDLIRLRNSRLGRHSALPEYDLVDFVCRGLDVCDFNGLFSVLHHPTVENWRGGVELFKASEVASALELVQFANVLDPGHSPFAVTRVWSLK